MRILVVPTTDWIKHPVPNRLNFIFDRLAERHEVYVIHFELKRFSQNPAAPTNCELMNVGKSRVNDLSLYYLLNSTKHARIVKKVISKKRIDVIVCANVLPSFMTTMVNGNIPVVFDYLDHLEESVAIYYPNSIVGAMGKLATKLIVHKVLGSAALITTVTEEFKSYLNSKGFGNIQVIPNGVDSKVIQPIPNDRAKRELGIDGLILGYVGSLEYWVDLETVLESIPEIINLGLDPKVLIVGPTLVTDYIHRLRRIIAKLGIEDRVIFCGPVPYTKTAYYISAMDICLNPQKPMLKNTLTLGGKVFTYLACGKPVLSSNMPSLTRLFETSDGVFPYDDKNFAKQVERVSEINHDSKRYRRVAMRYDWDNIAREFEKALTEVCQGIVR